jgi:hypothetical protein
MTRMQGSNRPLRAAATTAGTTLLLALGFAAPAGADVYTPTTFVDESTVNAADCQPAATDPCSLREALEAARNSSSDDEVVLSAGRYELDPGRGGLTLRWNLPDSEQSTGTLLVRGAGARLTTIDANATDENESRVLRIDARVVAELRDLGVTGGFVSEGSGAGISVGDSPDARVTLTRVHVFGNETNSAGGGITNFGNLTLVQSLVSANTAGTGGGGIANHDELTLTNSTVSGNSTSHGDGGGISNDGSSSDDNVVAERVVAGAIPAGAPFVRLESSTVASNLAPAGNGGGVATAVGQSATFVTLNAASGDPSAYARFHNSIVSDNTASGEANCSGNQAAGSGALTSSEGYNLEDGETCLFTATGDKDAAAKLDPLADNGGGTDTRALRSDAAAIDAADPGDCVTVDQRGTSRPQAAACDMGAFERVPPAAQQPTQTQPTQTQPDQPQAEPCVDRSRPITTLRDSGLTVRARSVTLKGTSRDPRGDCPSGVQRVEVSMAKVSGTDLNCRFIQRSNRFVLTPFQNCRQPILFVARGTTDWTFTFRGTLLPGKYRAQARAYDNARNKETPKKRRSIIYFEVK